MELGVLSRLRLPLGWSVVHDDDVVWVAAAPTAVAGVRPRIAVSAAPQISDLRGAVRVHLSALAATDPTLLVLDQAPTRTSAGVPAHRALCARHVDEVACTAEHWVVGGAGSATVAAALAPTAVWPALGDRLRRALRSVGTVAS